MNHDPSRERTLKALDSLKTKPGPLRQYLLLAWPDLPPVEGNDITPFTALLLSEDPNEPARLQFSNLLRQWDNSTEGSWIDSTTRNTRSRRDLIYQLLEVDVILSARIDQVIPFYSISEPVIISTEHKEWYHPETYQRDYYWPAYADYLRTCKKWNEDSVVEFDNATRSVVELLADPEGADAFRARGLVVGYVQSGKTANFTGVIAKAMDAGYRLIIVLAGTWNMLRSQTQRRIGKELLALQDDYSQIPKDWNEFISHGGMPSQKGAFDCERLTGLSDDYKRLKAAVGALRFPIRDQSKPFNAAINLFPSPARLIVMKKHPEVLKKLHKDLRAIGGLEQVPVLLIDDESDQAGLNTLRPGHARGRTETNRDIVELLKLFPRGQYIGYTATPYANVLVDPSDEEDLFPRNFILTLERPRDYMGISYFFDPEIPSSDVPKEDFSFKESAFIRDAYEEANPKHAESVKKALASYILSGALKLFREKHCPERYRFRHHTMLVHSGVNQMQHVTDRDQIEALLMRSAFSTPGGLKYLANLWKDDYLPVTIAQNTKGSEDLVPAKFEELHEFIGSCLDKVQSGQRTRILNSSSSGESAPDFEKDEVWEVIIGGNKLSRGYTIEGLTISYYLRVVSNADTLMQMGRWFGFRKGYRDLVRVFIGRKQGRREVDLVDSFKQACLMEERFRDDLRKYAKKQDGTRLRPIDVPPLIAISGELEPTARNKMWNAIITDKNFGGTWFMPTKMPLKVDHVLANQKVAEKLWKSAADLSRKMLGGVYSDGIRSIWEARVRTIGLQYFADFLRDFKWLNSTPTEIDLQLKFITEAKHEISSCILIAPQLKKKKIDWLNLSVKERQRLANGRFQIYGEPKHRAVARCLIEDRTEATSPRASGAAGQAKSLGDKGHRIAIRCLLVLVSFNDGMPLS